MAIMRVAENHQGRLRHCLNKTKRFLRKARDFYVDSMVNVEGRVFSGNVAVCPSIHASHLPNELGRPSSTCLIDRDNLDEYYKSISEKLRRSQSMSEKYSGSSAEFANAGGNRRVAGYGALDRSYSVSLGKIGTIDEEEPCDFHEQVAMKSDGIMFSRCRSHAVARKNGFY